MGSGEREDTGVIGSEARRIIRDFPLGIVATVTPNGEPAASPKGTFLVLDDITIAYGDIRSPGTRRNLEGNGKCEVVFVDPFLRKGVRIFGSSEIVSKDNELFGQLHMKWRDMWGDLAARIEAIVLIRAERVLPLSTPPYDDGASEAGMVTLYKKKYAEIYP